MCVFKKILANDVSSWECIIRQKGIQHETIKLSILDQVICQNNEQTYQSFTNARRSKTVKSSIKWKAKLLKKQVSKYLLSELRNISETESLIVFLLTLRWRQSSPFISLIRNLNWKVAFPTYHLISRNVYNMLAFSKDITMSKN